MSANAAGNWVSPGRKEIVPVGLSGVPPHVHLVAAGAGVAPPVSANAPATAHAAALIIARQRATPVAVLECCLWILMSLPLFVGFDGRA